MALPIAPASIDFGQIMQGRMDRQAYEAGQQRNRLTELALQNAPADIAAKNETRDLGLKSARLQYSEDQQKALGTGMAMTAIQMLQPLSNNDFAGAESIYDNFRQKAAADGLEVPEGQLKQALQTRNTTAIQGILSGTIAAAQQRGWLKTGANNRTPTTVQEFQFAKQNGFTGSYEDWVTTKSRANNPPAYGQFLITPEGYAFGDRRTGAVEPVKMDGQQLKSFTSDADSQGAVAAAKEGGKIGAKSQAEAAVNLPNVISNAEQTLTLIDDVLAHPGKGAATGTQGSIDPRNYITGTDAKDFQVKLAQLRGKTFLEAFASLKGSGAITDIEGKKAEDAIASLDRAQSTEQFNKSLNDLKQVVNNGMIRARERAGQNRRASDPRPAGDTAAQPAATPAQQPQRLRFNPQTGELE